MKKLLGACIIFSSCTVLFVESAIRPRGGAVAAMNQKQLVDDFHQKMSALRLLLNDTKNALMRQEPRGDNMLRSLVSLNSDVQNAFGIIERTISDADLCRLVSGAVQDWKRRNTDEFARINAWIMELQGSIRSTSPELMPQPKRQKIEQPKIRQPEIAKNTLHRFTQALQRMREALIHFDEEYAKTRDFDAQVAFERLEQARQEYGLAFDAFGFLQESFLKLDAQQRQRLDEQLGKSVEVWTSEQFNLLKTYRQIIDQKSRALQSTQAQIALAVIKQSEDWVKKARKRAAEAVVPISVSPKKGDLFRRAIEIMFVADEMHGPLKLQEVVKNLKGALFGLMDEEQLELLRDDTAYFDSWLTRLTQSLQEAADRIEQQKLPAASIQAEEKERAAVMQPVQPVVPAVQTVEPMQAASRPGSPMQLDEPAQQPQLPKSPLQRLRERKRALAQKAKGDALRNIDAQLRAKRAQPTGK